jgi:bacterioferritin-associated ferredoxin
MAEIVNRMDPKDCVQLTRTTPAANPCEGCTLYDQARELIADSMNNKSMVLQLRARCPEGALMNIGALGITTPPPRPEYRERGPYFVR